MLAKNFLLLEEKETLAVNCLVATQTKNQLAHELKYFKGEASDSTKKRSRAEDFSIPMGKHRKVVIGLEKIYRAQIEDLKKQMHNQKLAYESRIQEKEVQLSLAVEELERLKVQSGTPEAEGFLMSDV